MTTHTRALVVVALFLSSSQAAQAADLSSADATFVGHREHVVVSTAGDFNADGHDDLLFGSENPGGGRGSSRSVYVAYGPVSGTFDLSRADATLVEAGTRKHHDHDWPGHSLAGGDDVDGDGIDDVLIGATGDVTNRSYNGGAYLVHGPVTGRFDMFGAAAILIGEENSDLAGTGVSLPDVNADGHADLLVGATGNGVGGSAYLVLGPVTGRVRLSRADAKLTGSEFDWAGSAGSHADVDADGRDDLLIGAPGNADGGTDAGAAYVVLAPVRGAFDLATSDAVLVGEEAEDEAGWSVAGAGDVDDDGHEDLFVGAVGNDRGGSYAGAAYLVRGPVTGTHDLSTADAILVGKAGDYAGMSVAGVGDVDLDGFDDVLVGAPRNRDGGLHGGAAYLMTGPVTGTVDLAAADVALLGDATNQAQHDWQAGQSVAGAGDVDGDGRADLLIGTFGGDAYLVYGSSL